MYLKELEHILEALITVQINAVYVFYIKTGISVLSFSVIIGKNRYRKITISIKHIERVRKCFHAYIERNQNFQIVHTIYCSDRFEMEYVG